MKKIKLGKIMLVCLFLIMCACNNEDGIVRKEGVIEVNVVRQDSILVNITDRNKIKQLVSICNKSKFLYPYIVQTRYTLKFIYPDTTIRIGVVGEFLKTYDGAVYLSNSNLEKIIFHDSEY